MKGGKGVASMSSSTGCGRILSTVATMCVLVDRSIVKCSNGVAPV